jgi:hypothetical protein
MMIAKHALGALAAVSLVAGGSLVVVRPAYAASAEANFMEKKCGAGFGKKQAVGTAVGVGAGALIGGLLGGKTGGLIGAAAGGLLGNRIGHAKDKESCEKAKTAMMTALNSGASETVAVSFDKSSANYAYKIDKTYLRSIDLEVPMLPGRKIETAGAIQAVGVYQLTKPAVPRSAPNLAKATLSYATLPQDKKLAVLAASADGDWLLVSSSGRTAEGWVPATSLAATKDDPVAFAAANVENRQVEVRRVAFNQTCRAGHHELDVGGRVQAGEAENLCRDAKGEWAAV